MADVFTKEKRSDVMSRIKDKGNKDTELAMLYLMQKHRISGWRRNQRVLGKPDFVFRKEKIALFVDGCFWHSCPIHANTPKNNREFWIKKLKSSADRDVFVNRELKKLGWKVIRVWEHEFREPLKVVAKLNKHFQKLKTIAPSDMNELDSLIKQARQQAKEAGLKQADITSAIAKARGRK